MSIKSIRESELMMELSCLMEKAEEYRKAIPVLKNADLGRAAKMVSNVLELTGKSIRRINKELDRRKALEDVPGPKNMADAFRL